jgi:alpha-glucosidase
MHEVWVDGPQQEAIRRHYIEERYRLMPYLYTVAEETSHDGLPINRPIFLEFPHAIEDGTPFDLTTEGAEFLLGSRILIAPNPSPEEVAPYVVRLPPGTWYDYWTGEQYIRGVPGGSLDAEQRDLVLAEKQLSVTPKLDQMPVYVRGGSILPIALLTQSTAQTPSGPLTLRIYPLAASLKTAGEECGGEVYSDDGHTFSFRQGAYARIHFTCAVAPDGSVSVTIGKQEGTWKPWWRSYRIEVVGWKPKQSRGTDNGRSVPLAIAQGRWGVTVAADGNAKQVELR